MLTSKKHSSRLQLLCERPLLNRRRTNGLGSIPKEQHTDHRLESPVGSPQRADKERGAKGKEKIHAFQAFSWPGGHLTEETCASLSIQGLVTTIAIGSTNVGSRDVMVTILPFTIERRQRVPIDSLGVMSKLLALDHTLQAMHLPK